MTKTFWMIEKNIDGVAHWWVRKVYQFGYWDDSDRWTIDANKAQKYDTKLDADYVIGSDMVGCIATEHTWIENQGSQAQESA